MSSVPVHWYRNLWERHWWWRSRDQMLRRRLAAIAEGSNIRRILDVGCGDGLLFDFLGAYGEVTGIEPDFSRVSDPRHRHKISSASLDDQFQTESPFDLVTMFDVLEHIADDVGALRTLRRSMTPDGRLAITAPAHNWLWSRHDESEGHVRRYSPASLRNALAQAGFEVIEIRYFFFWTVLPMLARRAILPAGRPNPAGREHHPSIPIPPINALLKLISDWDHAISMILPPPIGTSIWALAGPARSAGAIASAANESGSPGEEPAR